VKSLYHVERFVSVLVLAQKAIPQEMALSPGLAFVKLDFLIGTNWGSNARRKQKRPSRSPNRRRNVP